MMDGFGHGWGMGWGWIIGIGILVLVVWLIVKVINQSNRPPTGGTGGGSSEKSALDILKDRYAKGEIDKEEFEERKKDLM